MKIPRLAFFSTAERTDSISVDDYSVTVTRKRVKNLRLRVSRFDGGISVSAPLWMSLESVRDFVRSKSDWLSRQRSKIHSLERESPQSFTSGEIHHFLGKPFVLEVVEKNSHPEVTLLDGAVMRLSVRPGTSEEGRGAVLRAWYAKSLGMLLVPEVSRLEKIMGVSVTDVRFRVMKTRWWTCNVVTKRISLNAELAKMPMSTVLYVLIHEMVHLLEPSHNDKFKRYMTVFSPDWKNQKAILNRSKPNTEPDDRV